MPFGMTWFVAIGLFSGLRTDEIKTLSPDQIKPEHIEVSPDWLQKRFRRQYAGKSLYEYPK